LSRFKGLGLKLLKTQIESGTFLFCPFGLQLIVFWFCWGVLLAEHVVPQEELIIKIGKTLGEGHI
jgi:hypothetical protein